MGLEKPQAHYILISFLFKSKLKLQLWIMQLTFYFKNKDYIIIISIVNALYFCQQATDKISTWAS